MTPNLITKFSAKSEAILFGLVQGREVNMTSWLSFQFSELVDQFVSVLSWADLAFCELVSNNFIGSGLP